MDKMIELMCLKILETDFECCLAMVRSIRTAFVIRVNEDYLDYVARVHWGLTWL